MTLELNDVQSIFANLVDARLTDAPRLMIEAGLPSEATDAILAEIAVTLTGVSRAIATGALRPAPQNEADEAALIALLADLADSAVANVLDAWNLRAHQAAGRASAALREFHRMRQERGQPSEYAIVKEARRRMGMPLFDDGALPIEYDGDGKHFTVNPHIRPAPGEK